MPTVRIVEPGWEGFTGQLGEVWFTGGVSDEPLTMREAEKLAGTMRIRDVDTGENPSATQRMAEERSYTAAQMEEAAKQRQSREAELARQREEMEEKLREELIAFDSASPTNVEVDVGTPASTDTVVVVDPEEVKIDFHYTFDSLAEIADKGGIKALREFAEPYDVRGPSIKAIIDSLMAVKDEKGE